MIFRKNKLVLVTLLTCLLALNFNLVEAKKAFSDEELTKFIYTNSSIYQLQLAAKQQLSNVKTKEKQQQIANGFQAQSIQVVEKSGLTVDEYNKIATNLEADKKLQKRVTSIVEDLKKEASKQSK
jgi:hypothetical protein